mmetsp:Transcript_30771/g.89881  ORF Transcript_30771/g.89881 Transcript_30771/m.89881 type:complete len:576 (+) Transcript_30771:380-2107(+)
MTIPTMLLRATSLADRTTTTTTTAAAEQQETPSCLPQHELPSNARTTTTTTTSSTTSIATAEECLRHMLAEEERVVSHLLGRTTSSPLSSFSAAANAHTNATAAACSGHLTVWRERVAQWLYTVVDHVSADRCAVYNVLLLLDAYVDAVLLSVPRASCADDDVDVDVDDVAIVDAPTYQLLAMSCLYLVLRMRGGDSGSAACLSVEQLVSMSRNDTTSSSTDGNKNSVITPSRIARTMKAVVRTLSASWRTYLVAPSPGEFVVAYVEQMQQATRASSSTSAHDGTTTTTTTNQGIDDLLQATRWASILDDATYLAELSVCDTYLRTDRPSVVAYAALLNVLRCHDEHEHESETVPATATTSNANTNTNTLRHDLQSLQALTGYVNVARTSVRAVYARLGYVRSQSSDGGGGTGNTAPTSHHQQYGEAEAAVAVVVPQEEEEEVQVEVAVKVVPTITATTAAIASSTPSPSPTAAASAGTKRRIAAVVSYEDVSAVVDAALPPTPSSDSDSEDEEMAMAMGAAVPSSGMKRVRSYSSDLASFASDAEADDGTATNTTNTIATTKRTRLVDAAARPY